MVKVGTSIKLFVYVESEFRDDDYGNLEVIAFVFSSEDGYKIRVVNSYD